jgi:hypothetical protein
LAALSCRHDFIYRFPGTRSSSPRTTQAGRILGQSAAFRGCIYQATHAAGIPAAFTGSLITDGYTGCRHLLSRLADIQQCCAHVIRRCRAAMKLGPGGAQPWADDIIAILRDAHHAVRRAWTRGTVPVRAENLIPGCDQQSCHPAVMITDHVPTVRLPPDYADGIVAAAVPA